MSNIDKFIPEEVDLNDPSTWTSKNYSDFLTAVHDHYGEFCGDCAFMDENDCCEKGHRPRKHDLFFGPFEYLHVRKNCEDFEKYAAPVNEENIRRHISGALDCAKQQYG